MRRGFALVAWLVATAVSVGISTAAVGSVRDQVSDRSNLVSLAALRAATTTTTTTTTEAVMREASVAVLPIRPESSSTTSTTTSTTTATSMPAAPSTTTTAAVRGAPETTPPPRPDDLAVEQVAVAGGVVTVGLANQSLQLIDALPEEGYRVEMGEWRDALIVVRFVGSDHLWDVVAELVDGHIRLSDRRTDGTPPGDRSSGDGDGAGWDDSDHWDERGDWDGDRHRHRDRSAEGGPDGEKDRPRGRGDGKVGFGDRGGDKAAHGEADSSADESPEVTETTVPAAPTTTS